MIPDPLAMIAAERAAAHDKRLGTDSRLQHALQALDWMEKWARYQEERVSWLEAAERGRGE